jgi:hypothetical protein
LLGRVPISSRAYEAAELLYAGHQVAEIAHASGNPENLTITTDRLIEIVANAQHKKKHVVIFVTGVPGSGKTLIGLNAIHDPRFRDEERPAGAFLSGNTPLVTVLREALAKDMAERKAKKLGEARRKVRTEIQGLMTCLEEYVVAHPDQAPPEKVSSASRPTSWSTGSGVLNRRSENGTARAMRRLLRPSLKRRSQPWNRMNSPTSLTRIGVGMLDRHSKHSGERD